MFQNFRSAYSASAVEVLFAFVAYSERAAADVAAVETSPVNAKTPQVLSLDSLPVTQASYGVELVMRKIVKLSKAVLWTI